MLHERLETPDGWSYEFRSSRGRLTVFVPRGEAATRPSLQFILKRPGQPPRRGIHRLGPADLAALRAGDLDPDALAARAAGTELEGP